MEKDILRNVWPEWQIVRQIGRGSFGIVYEASRLDHAIQSRAAVKVITIPQNEAEIGALQAEGLSEAEAKTYLRSVVSDFVREIQLMETFKGLQNIVSVEDYKVFENTKGIGWTIYIRMELLTPLNTYVRTRKMSETEIAKLGTDICTALELCARKKVIHRDIKPENIFVNQFGDFKLGDFGIARSLEHITVGLSRKGTYSYMAPEVVKGRVYDSAVDLYSLGLVMYQYANKNRLPFMNTEGQFDSRERMEAIHRRLSGEPLPDPCDVSSAMASVILRACAPEPGERFASAFEMKKAIEDAGQLGEDKDSTIQGNKTDKTIFVRKPPAENIDGIVEVQEETCPDKKKKPKKFIAAGTVLLLLVWITVVIFAVPRLGGSEENPKQGVGTENTVEDTGQDKTGIYSDYDEENIDEAITEAEALVEKEDYEGALTRIKTALVTYPKEGKLQNKEQEYTEMINEQTKTKALEDAEKLAGAGDYISAVRTLMETSPIIGEDKELTEKAEEYEDLYALDIAGQVDSLAQGKDYTKAEEILQTALQAFPENEKLKEKENMLENMKPQYLLTECPPYQTAGYHTEKSYSMAGTAYMNGFHLNDDEGGIAYFNLHGQYDTLSFDVGHIDNKRLETGYYYIYLDGVLAHTLTLDSSMLVEHVEIPLNGAWQLIIQGGNWCHCFALVNVMITGNGAGNTSLELTNTSKDVQYLLNVCPPYQTEGYYTEKTYSLAGDNYVNGFHLNDDYGGIAYFNLNGKYNTLTFDTGHIDGARLETGYYYFYLDEELVYTLTLDPSMLVQHMEIPLKNASQLVIEGGNWCHCFALVNVAVE